MRSLAIIPALLLAGYQAQASVTIYRDGYGVPSIAADTLQGAMYGAGYCQAQDHAERIAMSYKLARGRTAEVEGRAKLLQDGIVRSLGLEDAAVAYAPKLPAHQRELLEAFVAGENRALGEQKAKLPAWIEPFTVVDVLSLTQLINIAFPLEGLQGQLGLGVGSNQFALSPKKTTTHHPILSLDPHLSLDGADGIVWHEFGLYADGIQFRGVSVPGLPLGVGGHNDRVAWSETNNDPALVTVYEVKPNPANAKQYSFHGQWRDYGSKPATLRYMDGGTLHEFKQTVRTTEWGPMIPLSNKAVKFATVGDFTVLAQTEQMMRARSVDDFRKAMSLRGISMWNYVVADVDGHIAYQYNAHLNRRDESVNWRGLVDGSLPNTAWSNDLWTLDELPHAIDPQSGVVVNANSSPWLSTLGDEIPKLWPNYVTSYGESTRRSRLADLLGEGKRVSPESAMAIATDTLIPNAYPTAQRLSLYGDQKSDEVRVLGKWNGRADVDSAGPALYVAWLRERRANAGLAKKAGIGTAWTADETKAAAATLTAAAAKVKSDFGALDVPWGKVLRLVRGTTQIPTGGFGYMGGESAAVRPTSGAVQPGGWIHATFGSSTRMIVSLEPNGIRSWSILPYGNSDDPTSPHFNDQMSLYGAGKYKQDAFGLDAVKKTAKQSIVFAGL